MVCGASYGARGRPAVRRQPAPYDDCVDVHAETEPVTELLGPSRRNPPAVLLLGQLLKGAGLSVPRPLHRRVTGAFYGVPVAARLVALTRLPPPRELR